jgi:hypothetical protein
MSLHGYCQLCRQSPVVIAPWQDENYRPSHHLLPSGGDDERHVVDRIPARLELCP